MSITGRKSEHLRICQDNDVRFRDKSSGFERYDFLHCALPELDFNDVDTRYEFLGKELSFPFMISAMTGGCREALDLNRYLGELCEQCGVAVGVGSQRAMLADNSEAESFKIVRRLAPHGLVIGNIGAAQIRDKDALRNISYLADALQADAVAVHLNPLQEMLQPEGDTDFSGILAALERLAAGLDLPLIVKETGAGISGDLVRRLVDCGAAYIDVAGAGGTSWAAVEEMRRDSDMADSFCDWGIPTADCVISGAAVPGARIIASGGVRGGIDLAKAVALGAEIGGAAMPLLRAVSAGGTSAGAALLASWKKAFKAVLFLTGNSSVFEFKKNSRIILRGDRAAYGS